MNLRQFETEITQPSKKAMLLQLLNESPAMTAYEARRVQDLPGILIDTWKVLLLPHKNCTWAYDAATFTLTCTTHDLILAGPA